MAGYGYFLNIQNNRNSLETRYTQAVRTHPATYLHQIQLPARSICPVQTTQPRFLPPGQSERIPENQSGLWHLPGESPQCEFLLFGHLESPRPSPVQTSYPELLVNSTVSRHSSCR